jgi:hypothetical protein
MRKSILALAIAAAIASSGCSAPRLQDGYQFGDLTGTALDTTISLSELQDDYCATADPVARSILLGLMRSVVPEYPVKGLCTSVLDVLGGQQ